LLGEGQKSIEDITSRYNSKQLVILDDRDGPDAFSAHEACRLGESGLGPQRQHVCGHNQLDGDVLWNCRYRFRRPAARPTLEDRGKGISEVTVGYDTHQLAFHDYRQLIDSMGRHDFTGVLQRIQWSYGLYLPLHPVLGPHVFTFPSPCTDANYLPVGLNRGTFFAQGRCGLEVSTPAISFSSNITAAGAVP
jgi:hypothetical protein